MTTEGNYLHGAHGDAGLVDRSGDALRFGLLGPLLIWPPGPSPPVQPAGREGRLLAALLLRPAQPVWSDQLIDAVWGDDLPADPLATLHNVVYRLRVQLRDLGVTDPVVGRGTGYALLVAPERIDAGRFEGLVGSAVNADARADAAALNRALALWRGEAFEGLADRWYAFAIEARRLDALRFVALERRIELDIQVGRYREVIAELMSLTARWPARENLSGLLMVACHRAGLRDEALRAYRRLRDHLVSTVGMEPSRSIQEIETAILAESTRSGTRLA